jgi:hypothetical protein
VNLLSDSGWVCGTNLRRKTRPVNSEYSLYQFGFYQANFASLFVKVKLLSGFHCANFSLKKLSSYTVKA